MQLYRLIFSFLALITWQVSQGQCTLKTAPYTEDFESSSWTKGNNRAAGSVDTCWTGTPIDNFFFKTGSSNLFNTTGATNDHTKGNSSGKYLFSVGSVSNFGNDTAEAISPPIDISSLSNPWLSYWYHMYGSDITFLETLISTDGGQTYTSLKKLNGQQQTSKTAPWKEQGIDLQSYANDTIQIKFKTVRQGFDFNILTCIDDFKVAEKPSCPTPTNLTLDYITQNTAKISWQTGGAANWQVEYGNPGFTPGTGTLINVTTNPFTVTGLNASTSFDFYVRDSCGTGSTSLFTGPVKGAASCGAVTAPVKVNFDRAPWIVPVRLTDSGGVNTCWTRKNIPDYYWQTGNNTLVLNHNTGPGTDHTSGNGQFLFTVMPNFNNNNDAVITTYSIDVSGLTKPQLVFWYHMYGNKIGDLEVDVDDGSGFTNEWSKSGQQQSSVSDAWKEAKIDLSSYSNDTITIRFTGKTNSQSTNNAEIAIDDFWVRETPTCLAPTSVSVTNSTQNSLTVDWTSGGATKWLVGYRNSSSAGAYKYLSTNNKPFTITGLSPSTFYDIVVKDSCSANDVSFASASVSERTQCGVITAPYAENFDNQTAWQSITKKIDPCWSRIPIGGFGGFVFTWQPNSSQTTNFATGPNQDASGSGQYIFLNSGGGSGAAKITSSKIYIPANLQNPKFFFKYHMYGFRIDSLILKINNGQGWNTNNLAIVGQQQTSSSDPWRMDSLDLSSYKGDTIEFRFRGVTKPSFRADMAIDEIEITGKLLQPCNTPDSIWVSNIGQNSADVNINSDSNSTINLRYYEISAGPNADTLLKNVSSPVNLSALSLGTTYVVSAYDSCSATILSGAVSDTFTTAPCDTAVAAFNATQSFLSVNVDGSATQKADTLIWDFGDGTTQRGASVNASHTYASPGTYTITLTAFNICGSTDTATQTVKVCDSIPDAGFTLNLMQDSISLKPNVLDPNLNYFWDFGDGTTSTTPLENHTYGSFGNFTVTLTLINSCGDSASTTQNVEICDTVVADWFFTVLDTVGGQLTIEFNGTPSQNANTYEWDFDDGSFGTGAIVTHSYTIPNLFYEVTLTVKNSCSTDKLQFKLADRIGLEDINLQKQTLLYPNPALDQFTIEWPAQLYDLTEVELINSAGQIMMRDAITDDSGTIKMAVDHLPKGVYQVLLNTSRGTVMKKLLVQ